MLATPTNLRRTVWADPGDFLRRELGRIFVGPDDQEELVGKYPADIHEDDDGYHVEAELPGFTKDQIDVALEDNTLTITAQRQNSEKKGETHLRERRVTKVGRSFRLPTSVDESKVVAKLDNGVLHLMIPKRDEVKPRRIAIT